MTPPNTFLINNNTNYRPTNRTKIGKFGVIAEGCRKKMFQGTGIFRAKKLFKKVPTVINPIINNITVFDVSTSKNGVISLISNHRPESTTLSAKDLLFTHDVNPF
jgi:hypothetical protein